MVVPALLALKHDDERQRVAITDSLINQGFSGRNGSSGITRIETGGFKFRKFRNLPSKW